MDNIINKYLEGNSLAEDMLMDEIMEMYDYNLTNEEAKMLLHKKYGKPEIF